MRKSNFSKTKSLTSFGFVSLPKDDSWTGWENGAGPDYSLQPSFVNPILAENSTNPVGHPMKLQPAPGLVTSVPVDPNVNEFVFIAREDGFTVIEETENIVNIGSGRKPTNNTVSSNDNNNSDNSHSNSADEIIKSDSNVVTVDNVDAVMIQDASVSTAPRKVPCACRSLICLQTFVSESPNYCSVSG